MEYTYDSLGRRTGLQLKQNSATVFANQYTYDSMSRLATVSDGTNTATYSRISGSNLLNTTTITAGGIKQIFNSSGELSKVYDTGSGRMVEASRPFSGLAMEYDGGGDVSKVTSASGITEISYVAATQDMPKMLSTVTYKTVTGALLGTMTFNTVKTTGANGGVEITRTVTLTDSSSVITAKRETKFLEDGSSENRIYSVSGGTVGTVARLTRYSRTSIDSTTWAVNEEITAGGSTSTVLTRNKMFGWGSAAFEEIAAPGTNCERTTLFLYGV